MSYREHAPALTLAPWLACVWERTAEPHGRVRVLPDGCIDVVWSAARGAQLVGANTTAFMAVVAEREHVVGARLRPGAAPALLGVDAEWALDQRIALAQVLGDEGRRLTELLERSDDPAAALGRWLDRRAVRAPSPDPLVARAVAGLERHGRVSGLAGELGVSERALRRRVTSAVGYGPKRLGRVLRLRRALAAARAGEQLAGAAYAAGYADQAHFSHDCRELAGVSPSVLVVADAT